MSQSYLAPPSPWRALLWKDFQQVKAALLMLTVGFAAFQIISVGGWTLRPGNVNPLVLPLLFCGFTPILAVMACVGLLIGQERQTGTWAWSSSLPQSWRQALASKACVTLGASLLTALPLAIAPTILWSRGYRLPSADLWASVLAPGGVLVMMLELAVFLTVALLIFRDSLTGLIVGGIWTTIVQYGLASAGAIYFGHWLAGSFNLSTLGSNALLLLVAQIGILLLCGVGALLWLFRWRWSYGQAAEISWRRMGPTQVATRPSAALLVVPRAAPRGEFSMLLIQSFRSLWPIQLGIAVVAVVVHGFDSFVFLESSAVTTLLAVLLIGASTFHGDHTSQRYRFWADRGVSPHKLVAARSIPFAILLGLLALYIFLLNEYQPRHQLGELSWLYVLGCAAAYLIGLLSSLCFDKVAFSLAAALMTVVAIGLLATIAGLSGFYLFDVFQGWYLLSALSLIPLSLVGGLVYVVRLSRRWLIQDTPRLAGEYCWLMPALTLIPFLLPLLFGFLLLPNVPWQGVETPSPGSEASSPPLITEVVTTAPAPNMESAERALQALKLSTSHEPAWDAVTQTRAMFAEQWKEPENQRQITAWLKDLEAALEPDAAVDSASQPTAVGHRRVASSYEARQHIDHQIRLTATLGYLLAYHQEPELPQRMWKSNKRLQELNLRSDVSTIDVASHVFSYLTLAHLLQHLNSKQLAALGTPHEIRANFLLNRQQVASLAQLALRIEASRLRDELRSPIHSWQSLHMDTFPAATKLIPTLRWRQERSLAWELQQALTAIDGSPVQVVPALNLLRASYARWEELKLAEVGIDGSLGRLVGPDNVD